MDNSYCGCFFSYKSSNIHHFHLVDKNFLNRALFQNKSIANVQWNKSKSTIKNKNKTTKRCDEDCTNRCKDIDRGIETI